MSYSSSSRGSSTKSPYESCSYSSDKFCSSSLNSPEAAVRSHAKGTILLSSLKPSTNCITLRSLLRDLRNSLFVIYCVLQGFPCSFTPSSALRGSSSAQLCSYLTHSFRWLHVYTLRYGLPAFVDIHGLFTVMNLSSWHVVYVEIVERQPHNVEQLDRLYFISIYYGCLAQILYICSVNYRVDYNT